MTRTRETPTGAAERRLHRLTAERPELAPLANLQLAALPALARPGDCLTAIDVSVEAAQARVDHGEPWLHGAALTADRDRVHELALSLAQTAERSAAPGADRLVAALRSRQLDAAGALAATLTLETTPLATSLDLPDALLATVFGLALAPVLLAARARVAVDLDRWLHGYCPCCGAWPVVGFLEGLDRTRWLACGRCGQTWRLPWLLCPFCENQDHQTLGYLQPAGSEQRRISTCAVCHGYLKALTVLTVPELPVILVEDLTSVDLDLAALQPGWCRPEPPGFAVETAVTAAPPQAGWRGGLSNLLRGRP